jgi:hypothetical protein
MKIIKNEDLQSINQLKKRPPIHIQVKDKAHYQVRILIRTKLLINSIDIMWIPIRNMVAHHCYENLAY